MRQNGVLVVRSINVKISNDLRRLEDFVTADLSFRFCLLAPAKPHGDFQGLSLSLGLSDNARGAKQ